MRVGLVFLGRVLGGHFLGFSGELYVVGIIEHDEVIQSQRAGNAACALGYFFLDAAIRDVGVDGLRHHFGETCLQEFGGDGSTYGKGVSLPQRAGSVLNAAHDVPFRVPGRRTAPLAELLQFVQGEFVGQGQCGVEHGRHVPRIEEEAVAAFPCRVLGVVHQEFGEEHVDEIGATHGAARMTGVGFFNHRSSKYADVVCCAVHKFTVIHICNKLMNICRDD